ncbi:aprataxin and PNK-like factor [Eurosta solidaginis]|uniref:aprataxin and PNK-like factor n=1 Tax=Eurosta solidaginis TaxID=178769 RepID=UPI0035313270
MLPVDDDITLSEKESSGKSNEGKASSSNKHCNSNDNDGTHCGKKVRLEELGEINSDLNNINIINDISARKRESPIDQSSSKRCRTSEGEDTANNKFTGNDGECVSGFDNNNDKPDATENIQNSKGCSTTAVRIKIEPYVDATTSVNDVRYPDNRGTTVKIKSEPDIQTNEDATNNDGVPSSSSSTSPVDIKPAIKVEKADGSSTSRESCRFGIRCYRRNPTHRMEEAHPGDYDYQRPCYPLPPPGTPDCPYGDRCYRRNPTHFQQFNHPAQTDFEKNYKLRLRQHRQHEQSTNNPSNTTGYSSDSSNDLDLEDPFGNDEYLDSDYGPSGSEEDSDDDYDACDRAEE